jgi:hypothetical protein
MPCVGTCCVQECPQQPSPPKPVAAIIARPARCCAGRSLAFGSAPASRATRTPGTRNARRNRRRIVAAARISRRYLRMGSPRRAGRRCAVFRRRKLAVTKGHKLSIRRSRTPQPLRSGSQQRTRIVRVYRARSTQSPVERHASLDADGPSPKAAKWLRLRPRTSPIPLLGAAADIMASWPERELKQALLPAAIGSRADMAYSDAASTQNEVSHSELHRVDSDLAGAVQAALASTTDATIYIAHGSHAKPRIADARSTRHVVMPRSG